MKKSLTLPAKSTYFLSTKTNHLVVCSKLFSRLKRVKYLQAFLARIQ